MSAVVWVLAVWGLGSVVFAWAWGRAAALTPRPHTGGQLELIDRMAAASEARVLDDPAAVAAWLDGGDPR